MRETLVEDGSPLLLSLYHTLTLSCPAGPARRCRRRDGSVLPSPCQDQSLRLHEACPRQRREEVLEYGATRMPGRFSTHISLNML